MKIVIELEFPDKIYDRIPNEILFGNLEKSFPVSGVKFRVINRIASEKINFDMIEDAVCGYIGCTPQEIENPSRKGDGIVARQLCHHIAKNLHLGSLKEIGQRFGKKDHSTVLHSNSTVMNLLRTDIFYKKQYQTLIESFK